MKAMNGISSFDVQAMESLVQTDPLLRPARKALEEMGQDRHRGLLALYYSYVLGVTAEATPSDEDWILNN